VLRWLLRRPEFYLLAAIAVVAGVGWDSGRAPERQITAGVYVQAVRAYQHVVRPIIAPFARCRFTPTCSEYSIEAVRRFGIRRGLVLTTRRLLSCRPSVPVGTADPVPVV
jgi:uncharacterized protein